MKKKAGFLFWCGVVYLVGLLLFAVFGPHFRFSWEAQVASPMLPPFGTHWLGTDELGRDVMARLAYGARLSLIIGFSVQVLAVAIGICVGVVGVYGPKWLSTPLMRFTDGMFAFPDLLLAVLIAGLFSMGLVPVIVALAIGSWPSVARLVRTQVASLKDREFVVASQAMGASTPLIVVRHILPHLAGVLVAVMMVDIAATILAESTLSFLGIGVQLPEASWGSMIQSGNANKLVNPWLLLWPCLILSLTVFALNFVGDGLRALLDPKAKEA